MSGFTFTFRGMAAGAGAGLPLAVSCAVYGLVFGVLARQYGLSVVDAVVMSAMVSAGTSQFMVLDMWQTPLPVLAIVLTALIVNLRHILMGMTLQLFLSPLKPLQRYGSVFFLSDETWALTLRASAAGLRDGGFLLGAGLMLWTAWVSATAVGCLIGASLQDPARWGLDFAFAAVLLSLLTGMWKGRASLKPWAVAAIVSIAAAYWLPGKWYILIGGIAGSMTGEERDDL